PPDAGGSWSSGDTLCTRLASIQRGGRGGLSFPQLLEQPEPAPLAVATDVAPFLGILGKAQGGHDQGPEGEGHEAKGIDEAPGGPDREGPELDDGPQAQEGQGEEELQAMHVLVKG